MLHLLISSLRDPMKSFPETTARPERTEHSASHQFSRRGDESLLKSTAGSKVARDKQAAWRSDLK